MHSEHLTNVHPGWAAVGFVVAVAVTAAAHLALVATGFVPAGTPETVANCAALVLGFFAGGFFVGLRWVDAPVLNGVAIVILSTLVWFGTSLVGSDPMAAHLRLGGTAYTLGSLLLQLVGAIGGALAGRSTVRRGHVPDPAAIPPEA